MAKEEDLEFDLIKVSPPSISLLSNAYLRSVFQFFRHTEFHDPSNSIFDMSVKETLRLIQQLMDHFGQAGLQMSVRGEILYLNSKSIRPVAREFFVYRHMSKFLRLRGIASFRVLTVPTPENLKIFFWSLAKIEPGTSGVVEVSAYLKSQGILEFDVEAAQGDKNQVSQRSDGLADIELAAASIYTRIQRFVEVCFDNYQNSQSLQFEPPQQTLQDLAILGDDDLVDVFRLLAIKRYDRPYPYMAVNSCLMMTAWARSLRLPTSVITELAGACLLHPLVYLVRDSKPDASSEEITAGVFEILEGIKNIWPITDLQMLSAIEWFQKFEERGVYDAQGVQCYGHFSSRMIRIVALFEQMTTYQKGKRTYLPDEALAQLLKQDQPCDPTLLKLFVNWVGVYPMGSLVQLQSGEIAQIFAGASDPLKFQRPLVKILKDSEGELLPKPLLVDLSEVNEKLGIYKKSIRKTISIEDAKLPPNYFQLLSAKV